MVERRIGRRRLLLGSEADLAAFLLGCLVDSDGRIAPHVDLDLGEADLDAGREGSGATEAALFSALSIDADTPVLAGVSRKDSGDIEACREEWGEPRYQVDLRQAGSQDWLWDFWRVLGATLAGDSAAAPAVILAESDPRWVLLTAEWESNPMLFPARSGCSAHRLGELPGRPSRAQ